MIFDLSPYFPAVSVGRTEALFIEVDGVPYTAFLRAQLRASFKEAARAFEVTLAAEAGASATNRIFYAGAEVRIFATSDLFLTGYIDQKQPHLSATQATIRITGRSKSGDLIDSDVNHDTSYFENKTPLEIGNELAKGYGAKFISDQTMQKKERHTLTPGESIFRSVEKLSRQQGMTITGTPEGDAKITKPDGSRHAGGLIEGKNILVINADHNWSNRHSKYSFKGQRPFGHGARRLHLVAGARDSAVKRKREKIAVHDDDGTIEDMKNRVKNRRNRAAGNSLKANVSVQGFRDEGGKLWTPGNLIWTESPFCDVAQDMLIEAVNISQGPEGSITVLSVCDPRAYAASGAGGGRGSKSGAEWDEGTDEPQDETPAEDATP